MVSEQLQPVQAMRLLKRNGPRQRNLTRVPLRQYAVKFTPQMWDRWRAALKPDAKTLQLRAGIQELRGALSRFDKRFDKPGVWV